MYSGNPNISESSVSGSGIIKAEGDVEDIESDGVSPDLNIQDEEDVSIVDLKEFYEKVKPVFE